jgi:NAD(P)-dependent dehydrogenase (short-subunit alcohol dehydrogenase family)
MSDHAGRVALITGATGALGKAVTKAFRDAGVCVAGAATHWAPDVESTPGFIPLSANLMVVSEAAALIEQALARFGRLDMAIHLAGGFAGGHPIEDTPDEEWDHMWNLNLRTAVNVMRSAIPVMRRAGWGRIVAVGSKAGAESPAGLSAYVASKAALHAVIRVAAEEVRLAGITVNAVLPSVIDTPMNRKSMMDVQASRMVKPESIASHLLWLCSDAAADVNGALIPMYGRV